MDWRLFGKKILIANLGWGVLWLTPVVTVAIHRGLVAQANTSRSTVTVTHQGNETFLALLRRAESAARTAAQRTFDQDVLITSVVVTVIGQRGGTVTPLLALEVSRQDWRARPDPQRWSTYYRDAQALLGLDTGRPTATPSPGVSPSPRLGTGTPPSPTPQDDDLGI